MGTDGPFKKREREWDRKRERVRVRMRERERERMEMSTCEKDRWDVSERVKNDRQRKVKDVKCVRQRLYFGSSERERGEVS